MGMKFGSLYEICFSKFKELNYFSESELELVSQDFTKTVERFVTYQRDFEKISVNQNVFEDVDNFKSDVDNFLNSYIAITRKHPFFEIMLMNNGLYRYHTDYGIKNGFEGAMEFLRNIVDESVTEIENSRTNTAGRPIDPFSTMVVSPALKSLKDNSSALSKQTTIEYVRKCYEISLERKLIKKIPEHLKKIGKVKLFLQEINR